MILLPILEKEAFAKLSVFISSHSFFSHVRISYDGGLEERNHLCIASKSLFPFCSSVTLKTMPYYFSLFSAYSIERWNYFILFLCRTSNEHRVKVWILLALGIMYLKWAEFLQSICNSKVQKIQNLVFGNSTNEVPLYQINI